MSDPAPAPAEPPQPDHHAMRCPVCRAGQDWSNACRRCGADLSLLRSVAQACQAARRAALTALEKGDHARALREAQCHHRLAPGPKARRLLAICDFASRVAPTRA